MTVPNCVMFAFSLLDFDLQTQGHILVQMPFFFLFYFFFIELNLSVHVKFATFGTKISRNNLVLWFIVKLP